MSVQQIQLRKYKNVSQMWFITLKVLDELVLQINHYIYQLSSALV